MDELLKIAAIMDGVNYGDEDDRLKSIERDLFEKGIVVVFCYSDDLMEFRGFINDETGHKIYLHPQEILVEDYHDCDCVYCKYLDIRKHSKKISVNIKDGAYVIETEIPHATFKVMEYDDHYCTGIVFNFNQLED